MDKTNAYRAKADAVKAAYATAHARVEAEEAALVTTKARAAVATTATQVAQGIAASIQHRAHTRITRIVTRCLEVVFDNPYAFQIRFEEKRGKTEAIMEFVRGGVVYPARGAVGGGVIDVAAFALRLACLLLSTPPARRLLIADEPFRFVNGTAYQVRIGAMIEELSKEFGVQFIIVTDDDWLKIGKVIEVGGG